MSRIPRPLGETKIGWEDRALSELLGLTWPIVVSMLSYSVMTLVDTFFVGRLGASALAGVGLGGTLAFTLLCFGIGLLRAVKVLVAQALGAGRSHEQARSYLGAGIVLGLAFGSLAFVLAVGSTFILADLTEGRSGALASAYLIIRMSVSPLVLAFYALQEHRQGIGDARSPMIAAVLANVANIGLDYLCIVELGWGVEGAAWASAAAHLVSLLYLLLWQRSEGFGLRGLERARIVEVFRLGLPIGAEFILEMGAFLVLALVIAGMGEIEMAAHQVALQVLHFGFLPGVAISEATSILVGQVVGASRIDLVRRVSFLGLGVGLSYAMIFTFVLVFGAWEIAATFSVDPLVIQGAVVLLWLGGGFQLLDAANMVARGVLRGAGDVRYIALVGITSSWLTMPPLALLLGVHLRMGALGGWLGLALAIGVGALLFWRRLLRGEYRPAAEASARRQQALLEAALVAAE